MSEITLRYTAEGKTTTMTFDGNKHDWTVLAEKVRKKLFPNVELPFDPDLEESSAVVVEKTASEVTAGVREASRDAYTRLKASGKLQAQEKLVYDLLNAKSSRDWTRQEISRELGLGINAVAGRVHALINKKGMLRETKRRECKVTGESVMGVTVVERLL